VGGFDGEGLGISARLEPITPVCPPAVEKYSVFHPTPTSVPVYRRTFLATLPTLALAGCLRTLGLTDRVVLTEKRIEATELDLEAEAERSITLIARRETTAGPTYEDVHDDLEGRFDDDEPLVFEEELARELEAAYLDVTLHATICDTAPLNDPDAASGCREVSILTDDFNDCRVGDVLEVRSSDDGIGLLEVETRRDDRDS